VLVLDVHAHSFVDVSAWLTRDAREMPDAWNTLGFRSLVKIAIGFSHSFVGGGFVFAITAVRSIVTDALSGRDLRSEFYLVRHMSPIEAQVLLGLFLTALKIMLVVVLLTAKSLKKIWRSERDYVLPLLLMLGLFTIFFSVWDPSNAEFWVLQSVLCWLLVDRMMARLSRKLATYTRLSLVAIVVLVNFFGDIVYLRCADNDFYYAHARHVAAAMSPGDIVISDESEIIRAYYHRYLASASYSTNDLTDSAFAPKLTNAIDSTFRAGHSVLLKFDPLVGATDSIASRFARIWAAASVEPMSVHLESIDSVTFLIATPAQH
jgi:hypothetical protein